MSLKVLVLEDEIGIRSFVSLNLKKEGYEVIEAGTGEEAIELLEKHDIAIATLDVMLPGELSGYEVCKYIRRNHNHIRVIMLSAKGLEADKIIGLNYGAEDYVAKPFSVKELMARVNAQARRIQNDTKLIASNESKDIIHADSFKMDIRRKKFLKDDKEIVLTPTEFAIIKYLLLKNGEAVSRNEILDHVWGDDYIGDYKIIDVNMRRIRSKIEDNPSKPEYLKTVWGVGYCWRKED